MSFTAAKVITTVQEELLDPNGVYWSTPELLDYLTKGIKSIAALKPDLVATTTAFTLAANTTTQTIPADGFQFLDLVKNTAPTVSAIREVERNHLDHADLNWHAATGTQILHFTFDPRTPRIFYVYPGPANGSMTAEIVYAKSPADVTSTSDTINLDDVYEPPLVYYVLSMAYAKNTKRQDVSKSTGFMSLFGQYLGQKMQMQVQVSPRTTVQNGAA